MRLFVAIEIPAEIRSSLALFVAELRPKAPLAKWVRAENLHVTLKFLGETDPVRLPEIRNSLAGVHSPNPVTLDFQGLGLFPEERRPRVLWAGMDCSPNLATLAGDIDRTLRNCGVPSEKRAFTPHLTLARFDPPGLAPELAKAIAQNGARSFGRCTAGAFHLIESRLKSSGAEYTTLQSFPFEAGN